MFSCHAARIFFISYVKSRQLHLSKAVWFERTAVGSTQVSMPYAESTGSATVSEHRPTQDKSCIVSVRRSRVRNQDVRNFDIHDRVNYSVVKSELKINEAHTLIKLKLSVDTHFSSVMDYFEIFMERMRLCRKAAEKLGLKFKLMINEQQLI